jgi:hypothetical protein
MYHVMKSPFVAATGLAAFVHSTWALAVLFGGQPPDVTDLRSLLHWLLWASTAALIAFALDVGQINTSIQIADLHAAGKRPVAKYVTFFVFAFATYYLQWYHLIHHMPALELAPGIGDMPLVHTLKQAAVWIAPALLPASTLLYTFSHSSEKSHSSAPSVPPSPKPVAGAIVPVTAPASKAPRKSAASEKPAARRRKTTKKTSVVQQMLL